MAVLTEEEIRKRIGKQQSLKEIYINKEDIITPSARSYLTERNIVLKYHDKEKEKELGIEEEKNRENLQPSYTTIFGANLNKKPEHMTHLRGNVLVFKDHPKIILRGKIDTLEASILEVQLLANKNKMPKLVEDLQEVIQFIRTLLRNEITGEPIGDFLLQGLNEQELREQSYHPSKYFGVKHFLPHYNMGEVMVALNKLRTLTRETEIAAYKAFKNEYGQLEREDIIQAFNRLSSLFWIMMFKVKTEKYR